MRLFLLYPAPRLLTHPDRKGLHAVCRPRNVRSCARAWSFLAGRRRPVRRSDRSCATPGVPGLPGVPRDECLEPAGRPAGSGAWLGCDRRVDRDVGPPSPRLRLRVLEREPDRDSGYGGRKRHASVERVVRVRRRERSRPYPIPANVQIEDGSDAHAILVDRDACKLYELFALTRSSGSGWHAGSGAIWPLATNRLRPAGWTSADAAGLPILPGLARTSPASRCRLAWFSRP